MPKWGVWNTARVHGGSGTAYIFIVFLKSGLPTLRASGLGSAEHRGAGSKGAALSWRNGAEAAAEETGTLQANHVVPDFLGRV